MARLGLVTPGKSLGLTAGLAGLNAADLAYIVRRIALTALAISALIAGLSAASAADLGVANSGVTPDASGIYVEAVSPTGYGWHDGIREGQTILALVASDEPGGWRIETRDNSGSRHESLGATADAGVRDSMPVGIAALVAASLAVLFLTTRRRWVAPAAALALLAAGVPLRLEGGVEMSTAVMAGAAIVPVVNLGRRVPVRLGIRAAGIGIFVTLVVAWAIARLSGHEAYPQLEGLRDSLALWGVAALLVDRAVVPMLRGESISVNRPRLFDVAVIAGFAAVAVLLMNPPFNVSPLVIGALLLIVVAVLPSSRRRIGQPLENVLLGDVREAAAAEAAEAERARLARELHDVPLQELVAVIRRLEIMPGTEAESEDLRALAGHLRNVATELRPPVLDDLGLPAALDYLAEEATTSALPVTAELVDDTGFGTDRRPPPEVELAMFRIASEAVGNAVRHSGGSEVRIRGAIAPDRVELIVADDGSGLSSETAREAAKRKRLGLASMRRRAQAIDAELSIDGAASGTNVRVVWQA